ncbi:GAF domain-containing protein [Actinomadura welshii]
MAGDEPPPAGWGPPAGARAADDHARFAASFDVMAAVLNGDRLPDLLTLVAARARAMARVPLAFIALPVADGNTLRIEVAVGADGDRVRGLTVRRGRSMLGRAFGSRRALSARIAADQTLSALPSGPILILPLDTGEDTRGVLAVLGHPGAQPFDPSTARRLLLFADMAARLIELAEGRRATAPTDPAGGGAHIVGPLHPPRSTQT